MSYLIALNDVFLLMNTTCPVAPETLDSIIEWLTTHQILSEGRSDSFFRRHLFSGGHRTERDVIKAEACRFGIYDIHTAGKDSCRIVTQPGG
jgi:hypothetical protein